MSNTPPADYRNLVITSLGALTLAMGTMIAGAWNETTNALHEVAQIVAAQGERIESHGRELDRIANRMWESRP